MGRDSIATGPGADTLRYTLVTEGMDTIADFDVGSDKFDFSAVVGTPPSGKTWMDYIGLARSVQDGKEGTLVSLDPAGSGEPSYTMAFLQGVSPDALTAGNFGLPDAPPPALPVLSIAMDVGDQGEGTGGTTDFTFKLTRSILAPCSVTYTVAGSGEQPADNADFVAEDLTGTVTFPAGDASLTKMITVRVNGDTEPEPDETFTVTLNNPSGATIDLAEGSAEGIIYNDDIASPPPVTFSVTPATQTVGEGDGAVTFTISRSDFTAAQTVYVSTVQDQGFQNNGDYEGILDQPITFAAGDDQPQTVDVTIFDDSANPEVEPDETFSLLVEDTLGGIALASAMFTIADDDATNSGSLLLVSTDKNENPGNKGSHGPDISNDGLYIVYHSPATNIGDANGYDQVLMKNISTGSLFHVSTSETGVLGNSGSNSPSISNGAEYIAFTSGATNFTENDTFGYGDVFEKNVATWDITCASQNDRGEYANGECYYPSISADGRYVAFSEWEYSVKWNTIVKDLETGETVNILEKYGYMDGHAVNSAISSDGRYLAFEGSDGLVAQDYNGWWDVYAAQNPLISEDGDFWWA